MRKILLVLLLLALPLGLAVRHGAIALRDDARLEGLSAELEPELGAFAARSRPRTPAFGEPAAGEA